MDKRINSIELQLNPFFFFFLIRPGAYENAELFLAFFFPGGLEEGGFAHAGRAGEGKSGAPTSAPSRNLSAGSIPAKQSRGTPVGRGKERSGEEAG